MRRSMIGLLLASLLLSGVSFADTPQQKTAILIEAHSMRESVDSHEKKRLEFLQSAKKRKSVRKNIKLKDLGER